LVAGDTVLFAGAYPNFCTVKIRHGKEAPPDINGPFPAAGMTVQPDHGMVPAAKDLACGRNFPHGIQVFSTFVVIRKHKDGYPAGCCGRSGEVEHFGDWSVAGKNMLQRPPAAGNREFF